MANTWLNNDGLYRKFGTAQATAKRGGEYEFDGPMHVVEFKLNLADLTETETILDDTVMLPKGALIQFVQVVPTTVAATGTAIDIGLIKADRTTQYDYDGILAAYPTASMDAVGETNTLSAGVGTYNGAVLGVALTETVYVSGSRTTATAFTGVIRIRLEYFVP